MSPIPEPTVADPAPYRGKGVTTSTKLMHQYRLASPVDHGIQGAAVRNKDGQVEIFTIGTDGTVWNYYPDSTSGTHYRRADTGLKGDFVAAGEQGGSIVVLAISKGSVNYVVKNLLKNQWRWSAVTAATLPLVPAGSTAVHPRGIYARTVDGHLFVGIDGSVDFPGGEFPAKAYCAASHWAVTAGSFQPWKGYALIKNTKMSDGLTSFWGFSSDADPGPVFSMLVVERPYRDGLVGSWTTIDGTGSVVGLPVSVPWSNIWQTCSATVDIEAPLDSFGRSPIYVIRSEGQLFRAIPKNREDARLTYSLGAISEKLGLTKVHAVQDHQGKTHLFCLSADKQLYHWEQDASSPTGFTQEPSAPLRFGVEWMTVARNAGGDIEFFYATNVGGDRLIRMTFNQHTTSWDDKPIETQSKPTPVAGVAAGATGGDQMERFISYSTDLSFTDPSGVPLVNTAVTVRASDRTTISVNGATFAIDAVTSASLKTSASGQVTITQQTSGLGVPDVWIHAEGLMPAGEVLVLQQYANGHDADDATLPKELQSIESRLEKTTKDEVANAAYTNPVTKKKELLLKESVRKCDDSTQALASAFQSCMKLRSPSMRATPHPRISREGSWTGLHFVPEESAHRHCRVVPHEGLRRWSLSFEDGRVSYQEHSADEVPAKMAELYSGALLAADGDDKPWWSSLGDFLESVLQTTIKVARLFVDGVTATFRFVVNGVHYVFKQVVEFVQESFDLIESVLATVYESVENFFEKTFEWIGFLLDWDDILRTRDAISYMLNTGLEFIPKIVDDLRAKVDSGFAKVNEAITSSFTELKNRMAGNSAGGYTEANRKSDPKFTHATGNNFLMNGLSNNLEGAKVGKTASASSVAVGDDPILTFLASFRTFANFDAQPKSKEAMAGLQAYMTKLGTQPDGFLTAVLSELIDLAQKLVEAIVSGVQKVIQDALAIVKDIVKEAQRLLNEPWEIPFVTAFYRYITRTDDHPNGSDLTFIDLVSLMIAIPSTTLCKLLTSDAPFKKPENVEAFKKRFSAESLANRYHGIPERAGLLEKVEAGDGFNDKLIVGVCAAVAQGCFWLTSTWADLLPFKTAPLPLTLSLLGLELATCVLTCPWYPWNGPIHVELRDKPPYNPAGGAAFTWLVTTIGGFGFDFCWFLGNHFLPEHSDDVGVILSWVPTLGATATTGFASWGASPLDLSLAWISLIPNYMKAFRLSIFPSTWSYKVVAASDGIFGVTIAILTGVQANLPSSSPTRLPAALPAS